MPLNNKVLTLALLLAGCGGGDGREGAPYIAAPPMDGQPAQSHPGPMAPRHESPRAEMPVSSIDQPAPADLPQGPGPRGTSGEQRYDTVGYAGLHDGAGSGPYSAATITVAQNTLPVGSYVEVTALDSGRTIIALIVDRASSGRIVELSRGAAQLLGVGDGAAVRVRLTTPSSPDQMALRSGRAASPRIDAPEGLLKALRRQLPAGIAPSPPVRRAPPPAARPGARYNQPAPAPTRAPPPAATAATRGGFIVQVAAFSTRDRAQIAARQVGGRIVVAGTVFRVQIGPFADSTSAKRARDEVARHGYGDARVVHIE
ncbi:endolytic peptidoglycan transglycosylase RlpA [Sphingomonas oligophenolica]|uniref:SPOR domain-containing protein n=1 Tax=Sphingomonas oligophenolica TaxID=301154 RepID=A0ABU9Y4A3_9SPHN